MHRIRRAKRKAVFNTENYFSPTLYLDDGERHAVINNDIKPPFPPLMTCSPISEPIDFFFNFFNWASGGTTNVSEQLVEPPDIWDVLSLEAVIV